MPWHKKTKKDATTCEKRRGAGRKLWSVDIRMGKPGVGHTTSSCTEYIGVVKVYPGNWNILVPGGKERESYSVSSGERKRRSPNQPKGWGYGPHNGDYIPVEGVGMLRQRGWKPRRRTSVILGGIQSTARHVEPCRKLRRPLRKAKY